MFFLPIFKHGRLLFLQCFIHFECLYHLVQQAAVGVLLQAASTALVVFGWLSALRSPIHWRAAPLEWNNTQIYHLHCLPVENKHVTQNPVTLVLQLPKHRFDSLLHGVAFITSHNHWAACFMSFLPTQEGPLHYYIKPSKDDVTSITLATK